MKSGAGNSRRVAAWVALAAWLGAPIAGAQVLYKWVDKAGVTHYADKVPKGFTGSVTKMEFDPGTNVAPPAKPEPLTPAPEAKPRAPDIAAQRRATRETLEARVRAAHDRVAAAKKALEQNNDIQDGEGQVIQLQYPANNPPQKMNCRPEGKKAVICPSIVPNEKYYDRMQALEEEYKAAQTELASAEVAYRRGVD